jgi:hypothetical protein
MRLIKITAASLCFLLAGCANNDYLRTEGLTLTAGDAVARNSSLQIIDPWPEGVEDTSINVPADRNETVIEGGKPTAPSTTSGANP